MQALQDKIKIKIKMQLQKEDSHVFLTLPEIRITKTNEEKMNKINHHGDIFLRDYLKKPK